MEGFRVQQQQHQSTDDTAIAATDSVKGQLQCDGDGVIQRTGDSSDGEDETCHSFNIECQCRAVLAQVQSPQASATTTCGGHFNDSSVSAETTSAVAVSVHISVQPDLRQH